MQTALFFRVTDGFLTHKVITGSISNVIGTNVGSQGLGSQSSSFGGSFLGGSCLVGLGVVDGEGLSFPS